MRAELQKGIVNRNMDEAEDIGDWQSVGSYHRRSVGEQYLDSGFDLHVHLLLGSEEFCAFFDRGNDHAHPREAALVRHQVDGEGGSPVGEQVSMFVHVAKNLEEPKSLVSAIARLQTIDDCFHSIGHPAYLVPLFCAVFGRIDEDRELVAGAWGLIVGKNKLPEQVVETGSAIVEGISHEQAEVIGNERHLREAIDILSRLTVGLIGDFIEVEITEGSTAIIKVIEILSCSPSLGVGAIERSDHVEESQEDSEDTQRSRDTRPNTGRRDASLQEGGEARRREGIREPPPSEVASETSRTRGLGGCTAKHTRSGIPEDA